MTASGTVRQRTPHGQALRRLVARHPVATFLLLVFSVSVAVAQPRVLTQHDILPFDLALYDSLGPILGVALPAFVVVAATDGREGVRELASRCLHWRVGLRWYAFAFLSVPAGVLLCAWSLFGHPLLVVLADRWTSLVTVVLPQLVLLIICCIVAEEIGFMGFLQARWQDRFGPLKASLLVTIPFAIYHLPNLMVESGLGLAQFHVALAFLGVLAALQLFGRMVMMWLYNLTGSSVLLVGLWHASFDATTSAFGRTFAIPGAAANAELAGFWIPSAVVAMFAVLVVVLTRGRLAYHSPGDARRGQSQLRAERTASPEGSPLLLTKGDGS
jgi:membrane protease YdiL (CAAX protease family)